MSSDTRGIRPRPTSNALTVMAAFGWDRSAGVSPCRGSKGSGCRAAFAGGALCGEIMWEGAGKHFDTLRGD